MEALYSTLDKLFKKYSVKTITVRETFETITVSEAVLIRLRLFGADQIRCGLLSERILIYSLTGEDLILVVDLHKSNK